MSLLSVPLPVHRTLLPFSLRSIVYIQALHTDSIHVWTFEDEQTHQDFSSSVLIGIQPRGSVLTKRILSILMQDHNLKDISNGFLDITFFRDDFRRTKKVLSANKNLMDVSVENKKVVLIDDVLYTGRSVRAALTAIDSYGRPREIELLTLIDRRFSRHLPIQPDYLGRQVDAISNEKVLVHWEEEHGEDAVYIINKSNG